MRKGLMFLIAGSLLFTGCNVAANTDEGDVTSITTLNKENNDIAETEQIVDTRETVTITEEVFTADENSGEGNYIIPPKENVSEIWGSENVRPFDFNNKINIFLPFTWIDFYNVHSTLKIGSFMNKDYIEAYINEYKDELGESLFFTDNLVKYAGDSLMGMKLYNIGELWSFITDSEYDNYFTDEEYYKIGTNEGKSYYIFIHPNSFFTYGHALPSPSYGTFKDEYYEKICKSAYVSNLAVY